ncbi:hypothetical protein MLD38_038568 [Melastoma candidum]|uniref:Uncharacterized protein n=1 Tax=Melastoma candidum TaxID=119954 RepID=A0ACB9L061_9MYRT|nr:hypothetical protein MLD38_038568 [Melastoma candidum]
MSQSSMAALRVFRGSRPLFFPSATAKSSAAPAAGAASKAAKPKKEAAASSSASSPKRTTTRPSGIQKVTPVSPALAHFLNSPSASRVEAVKKIWSYIKLHNLQNPTNKKEIYCDAKLKSIFDGKEKVGFLEIGKLLTRHFKTN